MRQESDKQGPSHIEAAAPEPESPVKRTCKSTGMALLSFLSQASSRMTLW